MLQLVVSFSLASIFIFNDDAKQFAVTYREILDLYLMARILIFVLIKCQKFLRKTSVNFVFLFIFTMAEGVMLGSVSSIVNEKYVSFHKQKERERGRE